MLRSTWATYEARAGGARHNARRTWRDRVCFGGVAFELLSDQPLRHDPADADARFVQRGVDPRAIADVVCAVRIDGADTFGERGNAIRWQHDSVTQTTRVRARCLEVELSKLGPRKYAAAARIAPADEARVGLLRALAAAIVHREGGVMLHAVGVEIDGRAALFLGPSGAGKSTAARLSDGARCFAFDHVAVVPGEGGLLAWGLPGGTPAQAPPAAAVAYPLAAAFRVRKTGGTEAPRGEWLSGIEALFALRESVECADPSPGGEDVYLHAVTKLSAELPVGAIHTVLDRPHGALLRELLREAQEGRGEGSQP